MRKPFDVSVLIPTYNGERYIAESVESVLQQTLQPAEIIVFDDGSTDGTAAIVKGFGERVRYLGPERRGFVAARNYLVSQASHEWIAFQDHDDLWVPEKLEKQVDYLEAHPEADACLGLSEQFLEPGYSLPANYRKEMLEEPTPMPFIQNMLASRAVFDRVGAFGLDDALAADSDWFVRARDCGVQIGVVQEVLFKRRWHDTNFTHTFEPDEFDRSIFNTLRRSIQRKRDD